MRSIYYENKQEYGKVSRGRKEGISRFLAGKTHLKILDLGCGQGMLGDTLKKNFRSVVHGVDFSAEAIRMAQKNIDRAWYMDLETDEWPSEIINAKYDVLILSEVLEHLFYPEKLLEKIKLITGPETDVIITVPNLLFWKNRLKIFFGKFEYAKEGLMDRGHIHFFTWNSLQKMLIQTGHKIVDQHHHIPTRGTKIVGKLFPGLFAYQFIIKIEKNEN